jgi:hypothetical protein
MLALALNPEERAATMHVFGSASAAATSRHAPFHSGSKVQASGFFEQLAGLEAGPAVAEAGKPEVLTGTATNLAVPQATRYAQRRAVIGRGGRVLDDLLKLQTCLLNELDMADALNRLELDLAGMTECVDDPELAALLQQIALRAQIELAKRGSGAG